MTARVKCIYENGWVKFRPKRKLPIKNGQEVLVEIFCGEQAESADIYTYAEKLAVKKGFKGYTEEDIENIIHEYRKIAV